MGANNTRIKTALDGTRGLYQAGMSEKIDVDRLDVIYNNQLVETEKLGRMSEVFMYMLKFQMGMNNSASLTLTDKLADLKLDVGNNVSAEKFEYSKRAEFSLLETQLKLAQLDLKRNKLSFLPTAVAYGSLSANAFRNSYNFLNPNLGWYPTALVGAKISMPIFSGLQNHAKIQQAKMSMQKTENSIESMKQYIDLSIMSSMTSLKNAAASLENQKKNIVIAEDVYRISKIKYEQGVGSFIELLTAETSLKESQTNYFSAMVDALVAKIEYDKANGSVGGVK